MDAEETCFCTVQDSKARGDKRKHGLHQPFGGFIFPIALVEYRAIHSPPLRPFAALLKGLPERNRDIVCE